AALKGRRIPQRPAGYLQVLGVGVRSSPRKTTLVPRPPTVPNFPARAAKPCFTRAAIAAAVSAHRASRPSPSVQAFGPPSPRGFTQDELGNKQGANAPGLVVAMGRSIAPPVEDSGGGAPRCPVRPVSAPAARTNVSRSRPSSASRSVSVRNQGVSGVGVLLDDLVMRGQFTMKELGYMQSNYQQSFPRHVGEPKL
ncbi:unnamed protein product, partial [Polarella glacialis]